MTLEAKYIKNYFADLQPKRPQVSGTVSDVSYDGTTGRQDRIVVSVGGSSILVPLSMTTPPLAESDRVQLEQVGTAANAQYRIVDAAGARPAAGVVQYYGDGLPGGLPVAAGDIILGGIGATDPNFFYDFSEGAWFARTGATVNGSWASNGTIISGNVAGPNIQITPTALNVRNALVTALDLTATYGIRMYSGATQRVSIAPDGSGWFVASNAISWTTGGALSIAGNLSAGTIDIGGADATSFHVDIDGNIWSGAATYAAAPFKVSSAGALTSISGDIGGWSILTGQLYAGSGSNRVGLRPGDYPFYAGSENSAAAPFRVTQSGDVFAQNITASGSIRASVFEYATISAFAGGLVVAKSAGKLAAAYTVGGTMTIETPAAGGWTFATNDIIRIKSLATYGVGDSWITVTRTATTNVYTTTYQAGNNGIVFPAGTACVDYGVSGQGYFAVAADGTFGATAAWVLATHAGAPWTTTTTQVYAGTDGKLYAGGGDVVLDADGITVNVGTSYDATGSVKFVSTSLASQLRSYFNSGSHNTIQLITEARASTPAAVELYAFSPVSQEAQVLLVATSNAGMSEKTSMIQMRAASSLTPSESIFYSSTSHEFGGYIIASAIRPAANSTTALQLQNAAGTAVVTVDTTNGMVGINCTPTAYFHGGTNTVLEVHNAGTAANSMAHVILSTGATSNVGAAGSITWVASNASTNKGVAYIGGLLAADSTTNASGILLFATANAATPVERLRIAPTEMVVNEDAGDFDFRAETDSGYNGVYVDASNDAANIMYHGSGKVGFYGVTPITRAVLATGAGATVDNVISALQALGLVKQS